MSSAPRRHVERLNPRLRSGILYCASDMHLRTDRPERGAHIAAWVDSLEPEATLIVVGDLCDFWFASRESHAYGGSCAGLESLRRFVQKGGELLVLPGNHDAAIGSFYERVLGARFVDALEADLDVHGHRLRLIHGHHHGATSRWKQVMETDAFLRLYKALPGQVATRLSGRLEASNLSSMSEAHRRHLNCYAAYAAQAALDRDAVLFGHVHESIDWQSPRARLIVLGDWIDGDQAFVRIDSRELRFHPKSRPGASGFPATFQLDAAALTPATSNPGGPSQ